MAEIMSLKEKLDILMRVDALRKSGQEGAAAKLVKTVPMPSYLAKMWKDHGFTDYLKNSGWNMAEAEASFGQNWITR